MTTEAIEPTTHDRPNGNGRGASRTHRPAVDIFDTPDAVLLLADLPGADPESLDVAIESGVLTVEASLLPRAHAPHEDGGYRRRFTVDDSIDAETVTAGYRDGVLEVRLPKAQTARRRRIPVSSNAGNAS